MQLYNKSINKDIPIPLYYQLKTILLEYINEINTNHSNYENPIPTEVEISKHFGISRPTVRQAINELVVEGYLYRKKAIGTFVAKQKINQDFLLVLDSFNKEMMQKGLTPSTKVLDVKVVKSFKNVSKALKLNGGKVIQLSRLRYANDEPIVFVMTYLPYELCQPILKGDLENNSLYELLENECNLTITDAQRSLESILAGEFEANLLQIEKGAPIQFFESIAYLADGTPIEYSLAKYRGDRNKFTFKLKRES